MRRKYRLHKYDLRQQRKQVLQRIRQQEMLASKVMKRYANKYGIKTPKTVHFRPFKNVKDWGKSLATVPKKNIGPNTKYMPVTMATHEMVRDSKSAFQEGEAREAASEAVNGALKSLSTKPDLTTDNLNADGYYD